MNEQDIGATIERKLDELQARLDRRAFDQAVERLPLLKALYGTGLGSNYQAQTLKLSKHFRAFSL